MAADTSKPARDAMDRRRFLAACAQAGIAGAALTSLPAWARDALAAPVRGRVPPRQIIGPADLIVRNEWPEHWETSISALGRDWITSSERFFVRSHFPVPAIDRATYRLEVAGLVGRPLTLTLAELRAMPKIELPVTLECAGNGRGLFALPSTSGTQWERGAVGNALWTGVSLGRLLERAEPRPEAKHVWFEAADHAPAYDPPRFLRSIPMDKATRDAMLAYAMNGATLDARHGFPVRAVVPGWFGMASTKWVTRIRLEDHPSDNHFMAKGYRYTYPGKDPASAPPVEEMLVKSIITRPLDGERLPPGPIAVAGFAWAGDAGVRAVEVMANSLNGSVPARLLGEARPNAWRAWTAETGSSLRGRVTIMARATDGAGVSQPMFASPNAGGYGNNSVHRVIVHVA